MNEGQQEYGHTVQPGYYIYNDHAGTAHIVTSLSQVPPRFQAKVKYVEPAALPAEAPTTGQALREQLSNATRLPSSWHGLVGKARAILSPTPNSSSDWGINIPSVGLGLSLAVLLPLIWRFVRGHRGLLVRLGLVATTMLMLGTLYLTLLRHSVGAQSGAGLVATPSAVIEEARQAAKQIEQHNQANQLLLEQAADGEP